MVTVEMEMKVVSKNAKEIVCEVINGGDPVSEHQSGTYNDEQYDAYCYR